jgi:hypothetical protein
MSDTVEKLKILLATYKISGPISPNQQDYIIKQRKSDLKDLLKKTGGYGSIFWLSVLMYEGLRKFGIQVTLVQSKILLGITATLIVSGSSAGVYTSAKYIINVINRQHVKVEEKMIERKAEQINFNKKKSDQNKPLNEKKIENKSTYKDIEAKKTVEKNSKQEKDTNKNIKQKSDFDSDPFGNVPTL